MEVITYKCPNCGGDLTFDPASGKYKCEYCLSSFTQEEAEKANPKAAEALNGEDDAAGAQEASDAQKESSTEDDASDILILLPQPGGAFRPALGRIYAGFRAAV